MDINFLQEQVKNIFDMVSLLNVSGDAVDVMAAVRSKLRKLSADIAELKIAVKGEPGEPGVKEAGEDG